MKGKQNAVCAPAELNAIHQQKERGADTHYGMCEPRAWAKKKLFSKGYVLNGSIYDSDISISESGQKVDESLPESGKGGSHC